MVTKQGKTPPRKRRGRRWIGIVAILVAVTLILGILEWTGRIDLPFVGRTSKPGVFQVDEEGGTYPLPSGGQITVPKGAVDKSATLTVTAPRELAADEAAPLKGVRQGGVAFDVSLTRENERDIQPAKDKPLVLAMPTKAPATVGDERLLTLPYTSDGEGGYGLLPHKASGAGQLSIQLSHLSPKFVTYVTDQQLVDAFDAESVEKDRGKCDDDLTVGGVKVKIDHDRSRGWSLKKDSAIFACLAKSKENPNEYVRLNVLSRIDYLLSVAAADNVRTAASKGNAETQVVKSLSRRVFNLPKVKQYVGENEKFVGSIAAESLYSRDAIVELRADPHTYLAEVMWRMIQMMTNILIGEQSDKSAKVAKKIVGSVSVVSCLQDAVEKYQGKLNPNMAVDMVVNCSGPILEVVAKFHVVFKVLAALKELWDQMDDMKVMVERGLNGIRLTLADTLRVTVTAEPPPCPRGTKLHEIVKRGANTPSGSVTVDTWGESAECHGVWARGSANVGLHDPQTDTRTSFLLHFKGGEWRMIEEGQDMGGSPYCTDAGTPAIVRQWLSCYGQ